MDNLENSAKAIICRSQSPKIGSNPVYITPKDFSLPYQDNQYYVEKNRQNQQSPQQSKSLPSQQKQIQQQLHQEKSQVPLLLIILSALIWIGYALGSTQSKPIPINFGHVLDIIALVLSIPAIFLNIISNCKLQLVDLVHIYSIIQTILFFSYQNETFSPIMNGLRGIRLLFPLLFIEANKKNITLFKATMRRNVKYAFLFLLIILFFGVAAMQLFPGVLYFRCRPSEIPNEYYWPAISPSLCGSQQCAKGTFCRSPQQFGLRPLSYEITTEPNLYYGMINFENIYQSSKAIFEIGSLNAAYHAFSLLANNQDPIVLSILFIILLVFIRLVYAFFILENFDHLQKISKKQIKNVSSQKVSTQQIDLNLAVSVSFIQKSSNSTQTLTLKNTTWIQKLLLVLKNTLCLIHVILVTIFNSAELNSFDQIVGIFLAIVFIIWSVYFGFLVYYFFTDYLSQKQLQLFCFEALLYIIALFDYLARIQAQVFIMEQKSFLTPLSHALITLRLLNIMIYNLFDPQLSIYGNTIMKAGKNLLKFIFYFIVISFVFTLLFVFIDKRGQNIKGLMKQINFSMMLLYNYSWFELRKNQFYSIQSTVIQLILILIGIFIFLPYAYSKMMQKIFEQRQKLQKKSIRQDSILEQSDENQLKYEKKSFCCIDIENCIRKAMIDFLQNEKYSTGRSIFYVGYCLFVIVGKVFLDQQGYSIVSFIGEIIIFFDTIFQIFCKGFCGKKSFTQNSLVIILILCLNPFLLLCFIMNTQFGFLRLFQLSRILFYAHQAKQISNFWGFLFEGMRIFKRFFIYLLICILALINLLVIPIAKSNLGLNKFTIIKKAFVSSIIVLFEKGFSWEYIINFNQNSSLMNICAVTFTIFMSFSINLLLYPSIIVTLYMNFHKKNQESLINQNPSLSYQSIQKRNVQQYILSLQPQINPYQVNCNNFLAKFYNSASYKYFMLILQLCSLLCLIFLWPQLAIKVRFFLCTFHFVCFLTQLILFFGEIYVYGFNTNNLWLRLAIYTLTVIPGSILIFVPPLNYTSNSFQLKIIILLFCSLTVFRLFQILAHLKKWYSEILKKMYSLLWKMRDLIIFNLVIVGCSVVIIQDNLQFKSQRFSEFTYTLGVAITSLMGGSLSNFLIADNQQINDYKSIIVLCLSCIFSITMYSYFLAYLFYIFSQSRGTQLDQFKIKIKNFSEFWQKIDQNGVGVTSFKNILYFSKTLLPFFSISKSLAASYEQRRELFKSLNMPIYILKNQQNDEKQYVLLMHDVIYFFYRIPDYFQKRMVKKQSQFAQQLQQWTEKSYKKASKGLCKTFLKSSQIYYAYSAAKKWKRKLLYSKNKGNKEEIIHISGFQEVQNELCQSVANAQQHKQMMSSQRLMAPKIGKNLKLSTLGQVKKAADSQRFSNLHVLSQDYIHSPAGSHIRFGKGNNEAKISIGL